MAVASRALLLLALAALAVQADPPAHVAAMPAADGALEPEALEADDFCGPEEREDGSCSLSLRQLRGEVKAGSKVLANDASTAAEATAVAEGEGAVAAGEQVPAWWWTLTHPQSAPQYVPPQYGWATPSYTPAWGYSQVSHGPGPKSETTIYMYRAKGAKNFEDTNVNMANLAGVMWYLHNEVVRACPRKFGITRVLRYKVTMKATPELYSSTNHENFAHLCHFDSGKCTGPDNSLTDYARYGYAVGCDKPSTHVASYKDATWFSMPGACPRLTFASKNRYPTCKYQDPGGECKKGQAWSKTCTWRKEYAGEVSLKELTGVDATDSWCHQGNYEWKDHCDCGRGTSFWNGKQNHAKANERMDKLRSLFEKKYPNMPADLGEAHCPFGDRDR